MRISAPPIQEPLGRVGNENLLLSTVWIKWFNSIYSDFTNTYPATGGWNQTCVFSAASAVRVNWTGGLIRTAAGVSYTIDAGTTGTMSARTFIYFDANVSTSAYQYTTVSTTAVGAGKILVAVAQNNTGEAVFEVWSGGMNVDGSSIVAGSITANEIAANTITAGQIAAGTITTTQVAFTVPTNTNQLTDGANLGGTAAWSGVSGTGKPADNADVTLSAINGGLSVTGGGITLSGGGSLKGGQTAYDTGTGFFLGYSGSAYKFSIGQPSTGGLGSSFLTFDGSQLKVGGIITGYSSSGTPIEGYSVSNYGVFGTTASNTLGAVAGVNSGSGPGVVGSSVSGYAIHSAGTTYLGGNVTMAALATIDGIDLSVAAVYWDQAYYDRMHWDGGATDLVAATGRSSLGLGSIATQASSNVSITGGAISGVSSIGTTGALTLASGTANTGVIYFGSDGNDYLNWDGTNFRFYKAGNQHAVFGDYPYLNFGGTLKQLTVDVNGFVKAA